MSDQRTRQSSRRRPGEPPSRTGSAPGVSSGDGEPRGGRGVKGPSDPSSEDTNAPAGSGQARGAGLSWKPLAGIAAAIAIGAAAFFSFSSAPAVDQVGAAEEQQRAAAYEALLASPGLALTYVAPDEVEDAIADMPPSVTTEQREALRSDINQGRIRLAWVTLWDTMVEDGDVLRFESSSSIPIEITALNAKTTFAIPFPSDGNVIVTGVRDGGGGITIALESGATQIAWPTMEPGDQLRLPVTPAL